MRRSSLFWTFAGSFLAVLVVAAALQGFVIVRVVRMLEDRAARDRAEALTADAAREIAALPVLEDRDIMPVLRRLHAESGGLHVVFVTGDRMWLDRPAPRPIVDGIERAFGGVARVVRPGGPPRRPWLDAGREPRPFAEGPPGQPGPPPRFEGGPLGPPPDGRPRDRPGGPPDREMAPPADRGWPEPGPDGFRGPPSRIEILSRDTVRTSAIGFGEVVAIRPVLRAGFWPLPPAQRGMLFLPIALLLAGTAGLLMVRTLVGRLRALETLATRVAEGDLEARVVDPHGDEIGRLGERLNRMTERLAFARRDIEESDRQRRRLLADVSHELATPLTSIRGYAETLLDPKVPKSDEERSTYLRNVLEEAERLDLLIRDLFELTRLEAGTLPLNLERLDWVALVRNTAARFEARFRDAGLGLSWLDSVSEARVLADGRRLEQVIENLLVNALRYVPGGGTVWLSLERAAGAPARYRLVVRDDGPGIPADDLPRIFERFYRATSARDVPGSGLGLAIVKEIVLQHHGEIRVEAAAPRGAAFVIELPEA